MSIKLSILFLYLGLLLANCTGYQAQQKQELQRKVSQTAELDTATFAGGCFWCVEAPFESIHGVVDVISGYAGGKEKDPAYEEVAGGKTGHTESVQIIFDPYVISYAQLLDIFWRNLDPTDPGGSFYDRGSQYRSEIFYHNDEQKELAVYSKNSIEERRIFDKPIVTRITPYKEFYAAEEYHQDFYIKSPQRYYSYRKGSGRDAYIKKIWGDVETRLKKFEKPEGDVLKKTLTSQQYDVTQNDGTERAFGNLFWDEKRAGIYVDIVSGEPLFSSTDKYKSGSGWPSFTKPLNAANVIEKEDTKIFMTRSELRSKLADSHLGHVFDDGPAPTGLRYCINSAALRFVPKENLEKEGYGTISNYLKPRRNAFLLLQATLLLFLYNGESSAIGWTQKKSGTYVKLAARSVSATSFYDADGEKQDMEKLGLLSFSLYGEYGMSDDVTLFAFIPFLETISYTGLDRFTGIADADAGVRVKLGDFGQTVLSGALTLGLPLGDDGQKDGLLTGDGEFNQMLALELGHSFYPASWYLAARAGFNNRAAGYSDEVRYGLETGYTFTQKFLIILRLHGVKSLNNGGGIKGGIAGLYANNQQYLAYGPELNYSLNQHLGISLGFTSALAARNIYSAAVLTLGFSYTM